MRNLKNIVRRCNLFVERTGYIGGIAQGRGLGVGVRLGMGMDVEVGLRAISGAGTEVGVLNSNKGDLTIKNNRNKFSIFRGVLRQNSNVPALERRNETVNELMNNEEILKHFEENKHMSIDKLYNLIKSLSKKRADEKRDLVENEKFINILEEIENRLNIMNTRYLCNFALRLASLSISNEEIKKVLTKISENIMKKGNINPRDLVGICYALSLCNNMNEYFFEHIKKETVSNIDAYTPTLLTQLLESMRLSQNLDLELTNLIVEKMCEEIDRFTTKDVSLALKTLSMAGIPRGFLIRRLCNLVFDNISHFHYTALINIIYNLTKLKFTTVSHVDIIYKNVEEHLEHCNNASLSELLFTLYMNEINDEKKITKVFDYINYSHFQTAKTSTLIDFVHASTYYLKYIEKEKLIFLIDDILFKRNVPKSLTLIAKIREPIYYLASNDTIQYNIDKINSSWLNALNDFVRIDHEKLQALKTFHEIQKVLNTVSEKFHLHFEPLQVIESYSVDFVDQSKKIIIDIDTIVRHTSFQLKHDYYKLLGYKTGRIHFWKWRKCRTENEQQNYLSDILYSLTEHKQTVKETVKHTKTETEAETKAEMEVGVGTENEKEKKKELKIEIKGKGQS